MKKILVFGASGETGRYFVDYFLQQNCINDYEIIAVGNRKTNFFTDYFNIKYVQMDITQKNEFEKLPQSDVYAIVDLAGFMPARMEGDAHRKMIDVNLIGTLNILDYCVEKKVDRFLFAQSFGDIKDHALKNPVLQPDLPRNFSFNTDHTVYLIAKNAAVDLIEYYHQHFGLKTFVFRLPTIYLYAKDRYFFLNGNKTTLWYRVLIDKALNGEDIEIWGDPSRVKDMVYVKDFAQMLFLALFAKKEKGTYNVGTGVGVSLEEQIKVMVDLLNPPEKKSKIIYCPEKSSTPQYIMDISNAISDLNYTPKYFYKDFLLDYVDELKKGRFDNL